MKVIKCSNGHFYDADKHAACPHCGMVDNERYRMYDNCSKLYQKDNLLTNTTGFEIWQKNNKLFGKKISILGDSISTFEGYNPDGYKVFYDKERSLQAGLKDVSDTWWQMVIDFFGAELLVNNSWSGSRVAKISGNKELFPSGCSNERTNGLHINETMPDEIIVYLGTNDWAFGSILGNACLSLADDGEYCDFEIAYDNMLRKLKNNYPHSEIWCCTISTTYMSNNPEFKFPFMHDGTHIDVYNKTIKNVAFSNQCHIIDLNGNHIPYDSLDGTHPNAAGMRTIAKEIIRTIANSIALNETDLFLDCVNGEHNFIIADEYTGGTKYVCKDCLKVKQDSTLFPNSNKTTSNNKEKYIMISDTTTVLYPGILRLTEEKTGKIKEYEKTEITVGRGSTNDISIDNKYVARIQAAFVYEAPSWFLIDYNSTNGTYINGNRLEAGIKYQLASNDAISFAKQETFVFYGCLSKQQSKGDPDEKALIYLEAGMKSFAQSGYKDEVALKLIISALVDAPLYFPVEIDLDAMFGDIDPTKLKAGDTIQPNKDVRTRILTLCPEGGVETVPMFTSNEEANKGPSASIMRFYPQDYLPKLIAMDKPVIINPFNENRFLLSHQLIAEVLMPLVQNKTNPKKDENSKSNDRYIGRTINGKYDVLKIIGNGGYYTTYLVNEKNTNKKWAMKICDKSSGHYGSKLRESILTEPYIMQKLNHPSIPNVIDIIENDEGIFIVRDYIEGDTLEQIASERGPLPHNKVVEWSKQICGALYYLHSQNPPILHRDIKPHNIILDREGNVKIVDFGIAKEYTPKVISDFESFGTVGYAPTEQYNGMEDMRSDIYALGMTMFRLLTGVTPTDSAFEIKPVCQFNPNIPKGMGYIVDKCLEHNPDRRYQTCKELLEDLNNYDSLPKAKSILGKLFGK